MQLRITTLALLISLFTSVGLHSQVLQGSVFDRATGKPLKNVAVSVSGFASQTVTDRKGHFVFKGLKPGVYYFRISHIGYENADCEVVIGSDSLLSLGVALFPSVRQFDEEKVITPLRFEREIAISPSSVSAYSREQMLQDAPVSVPAALSGIPGVWNPLLSPGTEGLRIRGLSGNHTLMMVDGIRLNNPLLSSEINPWLNSVDKYWVDRVEVLRGAGAVQYGSDALAGVVQVFTRQPSFSDDGLKVHGNTFLQWASRDMEKSLRGELEISGSNIAVSGGLTRRLFGDVFPGKAQNALSPTAFGESSGDVKALIKLAPRHLLTLSWQRMDQENMPEYAKINPDEYQDYRHDPRSRELSYVRLVSSYDNKWFRQVKITGSFQRASDHIISHREKSNLEVARTEQTDTWGGMLEVLSRPNPYWNFVSGVEYYADDVLTAETGTDLNSGNVHEMTSPFQDGANVSGISMFSLHTLDVLKLRLSFGGRANISTLAFSNAEFGDVEIAPSALVGNVSAMYPIHPNVHLTSSFHTGFRSPNLNDYSNLGFSDQGIEVPNDSLSPEKSFTSEVGLKARTRFFSGSVVFYRTQLTDQINLIRSSYQGAWEYENQPVYRRTNLSQSFVQGFEAEVEIPVSRSVALYGSLAYTVGQNLTLNEPMPGIPPVNSRLGLRFRSKTGIWSKMEWYHATLQDRLSDSDIASVFIPEGGTPGWNVVNLHVGYDFNWGYATIGIRNMLDESYYIHGSGVPAAGRMLLLSLQLGF
ncbi:MAG: TonB-dependent receptor [Bacteroidia bacterium]